MRTPIVIIGAGMAGLAAACELYKAGVDFLLLEAGKTAGGRVRSDYKDGFIFDHGFQVLPTEYPEAQKLLDYKALNVKPFYQGALVWTGSSFERLGNPLSHPNDLWQILFSKAGSFSDKLKLATLAATLWGQPEGFIYDSPETTTQAYLEDNGFSKTFTEQFLRPFFGGIFLEPNLTTSSRMFEFAFHAFSKGQATLPANGMQAIPQQLVDRLPASQLRFRTRVGQLLPGKIMLEKGEAIRAETVILATDVLNANSLLPGVKPRMFNGSTCFYFAASTPPVTEPILVLNGMPGKAVNHLCVPNLVAPNYAPPGQNLISVTVLGYHTNLQSLSLQVRAELTEMFGKQVESWQLLDAYPVRDALPQINPPEQSVQEYPTRYAPGGHIYLAGDHLDVPSINGAIASGRRAAQAILHDAKMAPTPIAAIS